MLSERPLPVADEGSSRRKEIWSNASVSDQCDLFLTGNEQVALQKMNIACVAQLVVQLIRNEQVAGSSPVTSSNDKPLRIAF